MLYQRSAKSRQVPKKTGGQVAANAKAIRSSQVNVHPALQLQRCIGNRAVGRLIQTKNFGPQGKIFTILHKLPSRTSHRQHERIAGGLAPHNPTKPDLVAAGSMQRAISAETDKNKKTIRADEVRKQAEREARLQQNLVLSTLPANVIQCLPARVWGSRDATVSRPPNLIQSHIAKNIEIDVSGVSWRWAWKSEWNIYDASDTVVASEGSWKYPDYTLKQDVIKKGTPSDGKGNPWTARFEVTETGYPFGGDDPDNFPWGEAHFHVYASPIANAKFDKKEEIGNETFVIDMIDVKEGETADYSLTTSGSETRSESSSVTITNTAKISRDRESSLSLEYEGVGGGLKDKVGFAASRSIARMSGASLSRTQSLARTFNMKNLIPGTHAFYLRPVFLVLTGSADVLSQNKGVVSEQSSASGSIKIWKGYYLETKIKRAGGGNPVLQMSPEEFQKDKKAQKTLYAMARQARDRQQSFGEKLLKDNKITGGKVKSILKRDNLEEFVEGIVAKCKRNGYKTIGEMDDIIRGRFDLAAKQDVDAIAAALKNQSKFRVKVVVAPRRPQKGGGYGYPRWHIIVRDPETDLTHEWQIGTRAVTEVYEKKGIEVPDEMKDDIEKGRISNDIHDIEYDIFQQIKRKYPKVHKRYGLQVFHDKVDQLSAEAGLQGDKTPDLRKKIDQLHKEAAEYLKKLIDEFGIDWIRQFYH